MLRLVLPPNLAAAVLRDAIPVKVELDPTAVPAPGLFPVLAHLQRLCGTAAPPAFLQLTRAQLRDLAAASALEPIFVHNGQAGVWRHAALLGTPPPPASPPKPARPIENQKLRIQNPAAPQALRVDGSENFLALTLPSPEHPLYARAVELVKTSGFALDPSTRKWWLRDRHKTLNFLAAHGERLRKTFDADFTANFETHTARLRNAEVIADATETAGGFNLTVGLKAGPADDATLREAIATNRRYLEAGGQVYLIAPDQLEKLATAQRALAGDPTASVAPRRAQRVSSARVAEAETILEELAPGFQPPETWKTRSAALRNLTTLTPAPVEAALNDQLRPYQRLGVAWLWHLHRSELGGILADEMGLGKTLQALALLTGLQGPFRVPGSDFRATDPKPETQNPKPFPVLRRTPTHNSQSSTLNSRPASLVIAPASLLENWRRETLRFAPALRIFVHHGDHRLAAAADFAAHDLIITSYGTLTRDLDLFSSVDFAVVIADEAQHIKNRRSQNAAALRALRARSRFLLTGTPLENSLDDLRSLFEFLLPGYLQKVPAGLRGDERAWFDQRLRAQTAPYILRRTKLAVAPELPEKIEQIIWCDLTPAQAKLYRDTQENSERQLIDLAAAGASEGRLQFAALTQLLRLRQICCDPRLINKPAAPDLASDVGRDLVSRRPASENSPTDFADSAKLNAFTELLAEAIDDGHRLLVFSQFTSLLTLLREELDAQSISYCYLDGSMTPAARQAQVDRFQGTRSARSSTSVSGSQPSALNSQLPPIFLLSLKAGGTGLNLTGADTVIHFDPWWNPAAEAQATDRAHRIGQTRTVTSYKLICAGTVEEKVLALQAEKRALLADVFEASDAAAAKLTLADLRELLR